MLGAWSPYTTDAAAVEVLGDVGTHVIIFELFGV